MPLSGLEIYKLLPKTNCRECGFPTCIFFAMKLAAKQVEPSACPYLSEEAKAALAAAATPPMRLVTIGEDERKIEVGNETELFRHDKTFYHEPGLVVRVKDTQPLREIEELVAQVDEYRVQYVGMDMFLNGIAIENASGDAEAFSKCTEAVVAKTNLPLVLISKSAEAMEMALDRAKNASSLLYAADADNWSAMAELAKKYGSPLAVRNSDGLSGLANIVEQVKGAGVEDIVLDPGARTPAECLTTYTQIRRLALKENLRSLGYPIISFPGEGTTHPEEEVFMASEHIAKYGGIIVLDHFDPASAYPLLVLRRNIYTDPQKPIQMTAGIYELNDPTSDSPALVTTNFSITYFSVANEVEGSRMPAWLLVVDTEGLSVLTAWAAGKFDAETIAKAVSSTNLGERINHRRMVIPGQVAILLGELEDELPGWEIRVGPREAMDLPRYLRLKSWQNSP